MDWRNTLRFFGKNFNNPVSLIIIGLVGSEKIADSEFMCPCSEVGRWVIFFMYLLIPMFTTFTITFYLTFPPYEEKEKEKARQSYKKSSCTYWSKKLVICLFSSLIWMVLFFADGKYMACVQGQLNEKDVNTCKNKTDRSYSIFFSKIIGFALLLFLSLLTLTLKCCHPYLHSECIEKCCEECCDERCDKFCNNVPENEPLQQVIVLKFQVVPGDLIKCIESKVTE